MAEPLRVLVEARDDAIVASVHGEIDISNVEQVRTALEQAVDKTRARFIVDLTHTDYVDSIGIRLLFALAERLEIGRQSLHIVVPEASVIRRVLVLTDVPKVIPMHDDLDAALSAPSRRVI